MTFNPNFKSVVVMLVKGPTKHTEKSTLRVYLKKI